MINIVKYLKQYWKQILLVLILLFVQAYCDLSLPQYTSDIVDVGIQQKGIEDTAFKVISQPNFEKMKLFMKEEDIKLIEDNYKRVGRDEAEKYKKKYPLVLTEDIYILKTNDRETKEHIADILAMPCIIVDSFSTKNINEMPESKSDTGSTDPLENMDEKQQQDFMMKLVTGSAKATAANTAMTPEIMNELGKLQTMNETEKAEFMQDKLSRLIENEKGKATILNELELFYELDMMSKDELIDVGDSMKEQFGDMSELITKQMSIKAVSKEYEKVGLNIDKMQTRYLIDKGMMMIGMTFLMVVVSIIVGFIASRIAAGVGMNVRARLFKKVVRFSSAEVNKFSTASLITRSTNDIQQVQMVVVLLLRMIAYAPILGIGGIIKVANTKTSMGWIILVAVAILLGLIIVLMAIAMPKFKKMQTLVDNLNLVTREILTGIPVIRAFSRERHEEKRFELANMDLTKATLFTNRVMTFMMPVMMFVMNGVTVLILWNGTKAIDAGNLQVGDMMAFITYTMQIIMSFLMMSLISIVLPRAAVSANRIEEVLKTKSTITDKSNTVKPEGINGEVAFNQVSFIYPGADEAALSDISFTAKPGQTTAIIGSTGSGKSTLINLIPRFYDVTKGSITINGIDIRDMTQHDLRALIGYVPQKGILFSGTIESNLRFGREDATDDEIAQAAEIAQAKDFIETKNDKYDSHIAQGGNNVSGGQKQRLSIARAIAKNPNIYIFDDSFSALDFKTDVMLRKALKDKVSDSTVIIVAQRISTILHAEQILVLDEGRIVGKGTHEQLLGNCEVYRQIAQSQLSEKELAGKEQVVNE